MAARYGHITLDELRGAMDQHQQHHNSSGVLGIGRGFRQCSRQLVEMIGS
jgi:hypothetical protein